MNEHTNGNFKNLTENLFLAKKQKIQDVREGEKKVAKDKLLAEADRQAVAVAEKVLEKARRNRQFLKASERFAQKPTLD